MKSQPPKRALQFLRWFCREDYLEEIEGDLTELFERQSESSPRLRKDITTFLTEVRRIPGVVAASSIDGDLVGSNGGGGGIGWEGKDPNAGIEFDGLDVDYGLIELLGLEMLEGRTFSDKAGSDRKKVIFNATAIDMMLDHGGYSIR